LWAFFLFLLFHLFLFFLAFLFLRSLFLWLLLWLLTLLWLLRGSRQQQWLVLVLRLLLLRIVALLSTAYRILGLLIVAHETPDVHEVVARLLPADLYHGPGGSGLAWHRVLLSEVLVRVGVSSHDARDILLETDFFLTLHVGDIELAGDIHFVGGVAIRHHKTLFF
jgi:hypothetical protein